MFGFNRLEEPAHGIRVLIVKACSESSDETAHISRQNLFCAHTQEWDIDEDLGLNIRLLAQIDSCTYIVNEGLWICDLYPNLMRWAMYLFSCLEALQT